MRARALCFLWLALAAPGAAQGASGEPEPSAVWWTIPSEVEVGEPFRWLVEVRCPARSLVRLEEQLDLFAADLEPSWALLAPETLVSSPDDVDGWLRRRAGWTAISLEPGTRDLPALTLQLASGGTVTTEPASIEVAGVLGAGEDRPRPARGLREVPGADPESSVPTWIAGGAALALGLLAVFLLRHRRGADDHDEPSERDLLRARLASLEDSLPTDPAAVQVLFYELSGLLRGALDERAGRDRRGLTDPEWVAVVGRDEGLPDDVRTDLERFFERSSEVKYAAAQPTSWSIEEDLQRVRKVLAAQPAHTADSVRSVRTALAEANGSADRSGGKARA